MTTMKRFPENSVVIKEKWRQDRWVIEERGRVCDPFIRNGKSSSMVLCQTKT